MRDASVELGRAVRSETRFNGEKNFIQGARKAHARGAESPNCLLFGTGIRMFENSEEAIYPPHPSLCPECAQQDVTGRVRTSPNATVTPSCALYHIALEARRLCY